MRPPFFVIGAPRSGTTYLVEVLARHDQVVLTNETRVMTFFNRALNDLGRDRFVLMDRRAQFLDVFRQSIPDIVRAFYRSLGADDTCRWGDKFPHYADPRTDPQLLDLLDELFPECQFVHIVRDGRDVAASLVQKGWVDFEEACDVWVRHVAHARKVGHRLGLDRYHEIQYRDLTAEGVHTTARLLDFLDLAPNANVDAFLREQEERRTPFSGATTSKDAIGGNGWHTRLSDQQVDYANRVMADLLVEFRLEDHRWRAELPPAVLTKAAGQKA